MKIFKQLDKKGNEKSKNYYVVHYLKNAEGKLVQKWVNTGTDKKEVAQQFARNLEDSINEIKRKQRLEDFLGDVATKLTGQTIIKSGLPLSMVWERYESKNVNQSLTPRTIASKKVIWNHFEKWLEKNYPCERINDVTEHIANEYLQKNFAQMSSSTYNNHKWTLNHIWSQLKLDANLKDSLWERLSEPARKTAKVYRPFTDAERKFTSALRKLMI